MQKKKASSTTRDIIHGLKGKRDLEEAPGAYKNINEVIARQEGLIEINDILKPLAVIKG